jgi:hypothetical protein
MDRPHTQGVCTYDITLESPRAGGDLDAKKPTWRHSAEEELKAVGMSWEEAKKTKTCKSGGPMFYHSRSN